MNRKTAIPMTIALALVVALASAALGARSTANIIKGTSAIDGYKVGTSYTHARHAFGPQYSSLQSSKICTARWGNGVTISWRRREPFSKWTKACVRFSGARIGKGAASATPWGTNKGLRVGATTARLKALYPSATGQRSGVYTIFTLQKGLRVSLQAAVKDKSGKVAEFRFVTH